MSVDDPRRLPDGRERPDLAELLADQFAVLDDVRPTQPRVVELDETVVFAFSWPYVPADAAVARSPLRGRLQRLRRLLLEDMTDYLVEVVELDLHREVAGSAPVLGDDPREGMVTFVLGARKDRPEEDAEAVRNWSRQLRRQARRQRRRSQDLREELRRLREALDHRKRPRKA